MGHLKTSLTLCVCFMLNNDLIVSLDLSLSCAASAVFFNVVIVKKCIFPQHKVRCDVLLMHI